MLSLWLVALFVGPALGLTVKDLYPFGDQAGDTAMEKNDDGSSPEIFISTLFPFFNHQHSTLIVSRKQITILLVNMTLCQKGGGGGRVWYLSFLPTKR